MKQINTITEATIGAFDEEVNSALAGGWELVKRECLLVGAEHLPMFYAELEREIITEDEKTCDNCKHNHVNAMQEPCASCDPENGVCHWEAETN